MAAMPNEVVYQWILAYEYIYHVGVRPKGGLDNDGAMARPPEPTDTISAGMSSVGAGVGAGVDPIASLGVRLWPQTIKTKGVQAVDPVYGSPVESEEFSSHDEPVITLGYVEFNPEGDIVETPMDFGLRVTQEARMTTPYLHYRANDIDPPKRGDLVEFWGDSWEEFGVFYDVTKVVPDGYVNSSSYFVQYKMELRRREDYLPERRLLGDGLDHG
jgi:hypothetical protein